MKNSIKSVLAALCLAGLPAVAFAQSSAYDVNAGVSAWREGDIGEAWRVFKAGAEQGDAKAQRHLATIILDGDAPRGERADPFTGVDLLKQAARAGDYAALIRLEDLRTRQLAHSPSLADMIGIEIARAEAGDPVAAFRLAKRYETGEGVPASEKDAAKWLEVAASAETTRFPKAPEAAFRLCTINALGEEARDPQAARRWCAIAAENGHAGAAIVLRRLAQLNG